VSADLPPLRSHPNPPFYRDIQVIRWVGQVVVLLAALGVLWWLYSNAVTNLRASRLPTGFGFLSGRAGFGIPGIPDAANLTAGQAFVQGYLNTLRVIAVGIPACTVIGVLIGIARLSENAAVRTFGTIYVETFRNIPILLWIFFIYLVYILENLPAIERGVTPLGLFVISNRGIGIPWFNPDASTSTFMLVLAAGLIATVMVVKWRGRVNERTGALANGGRYGLATLVVAVIVAHLVSGGALAVDTPQVTGRVITGGMNVFPPYFGLTLALTLYTASHVAEIVRGAIQAVHTGQSEAANAIALSSYQRYRFVILPQASRIAIPPMASQYLNLTKNSSLAVAIGYVELTSLFQRFSNNAAPALQVLLVLMAAYLTFSLTISLIMNIFNRRMQLVGRT
jgi:general L-amino acid transport system permease protein